MVCAAAQLKDSTTWLEELVSDSNTIQAQEGITQAGLSACNIGVKLYMRLGRCFVRISGLDVRLGSRCLWCKIWALCFVWLQRGAHENPYGKDWASP